jgi:hypothetical protein
MAGMALVWVDTTMRTISPAAGFLVKGSDLIWETRKGKAVRGTYGSLLDDDVFDDKIFRLKTLGISVRFRVLQQP